MCTGALRKKFANVLHCGILPIVNVTWIRRGAVIAMIATALACRLAGGAEPWSPLYASANLTNHLLSFENSPGDPTTNFPSSLEDVALVIHEDYAEVISNIRLTNVFVNAIAYSRFDEVFPDGRPLGGGIFQYGADIRLPVAPTTVVGQTQNAESVQMMIQFWDGSNRTWQADKVALEATWFWDLNPWRTNEFGKLKVYTGGTGTLQLVDTGLVIPPDTNWHRIESVVDFVSTQFVSLVADGVRANLSTVAIARVYRPTWGNELVYQFTQESCATYPNPGYSNIFYWATEYRNVRFSRLSFHAGFSDPPFSNDVTRLEWPAEPYLSYQVWTSGALATWGPGTDAVTAAGALLQCDVPAGTNRSLFYRIRVEP